MLLRRLRDCVDQAGGGLGLAVEEGLPEPSRDESSLPEMSRGTEIQKYQNIGRRVSVKINECRAVYVTDLA